MKLISTYGTLFGISKKRIQYLHQFKVLKKTDY